MNRPSFHHTRALALAAMCLTASTLTAPAHAAASTVSTTGLNLPQGVTLAAAPSLSYEATFNVTNACMKFDYTGDATTLFFHDLAVNGSSMVGNTYIGRAEFSLPDLNANGRGFCVQVGAGDIRDKGASLSLSSSIGQTVLAEKTNLEFPDAYQTITSKLSDLGFTTTSGYMAWWMDAESGLTNYGMYVGITPKTDISAKPVTLTINNPVLRIANGNPLPFDSSSRTQTFSGADEIYFGWMATDPAVGLGRGQATPQLDADFSIVTQTTWTSTATLPAGLTISCDPQNWYYNDFTNTTYMSGVTLGNTSSKPISVSFGAAKLYSVSGQTLTNLNLPTESTQYVTVPPKATTYVSAFSGGLTGDFRYDKTLSFSAVVKTATPSSIDFKGVKIPSGYTLQPTSFDTLFYSPEEKKTTVMISLTQPKKSADKALVIAGATFNGKAVATEVSNGFSFDGGPLRTFYLIVGTVAGDARLGKSFTLKGSVTAQPKTTFKSTATLDKRNTGIELVQDAQSFPPSPWMANYDSVKKQTTISIKIMNPNETDVKLGRCKLTLKVNGSSVAINKRDVTVRGSDNPLVDLAVVSADLRYGAAIVLSGSFKYGGC